MTERLTITMSRHEFRKGDWVHFGGNRQNVAEVVDTKGEQITIRCIQPNKGKILYTTFSTSFTIPIDQEEKERIQSLLLKNEKAAIANLDYGDYIQSKDSDSVEDDVELVEEQESFEDIQTIVEEEELVLSEPGEDLQLSLF